MIDSNLTDIIPLLGLYAETHYRFPLFPFSRYFRREPEIIFDAPYRLQPGLPLPVTLIIKDANRFPIELEEVLIQGTGLDGGKISARFPINRFMECQFWHTIFDFDPGNLPPGLILVDCALTFRINGRQKVARNDNHRGLSHSPLSVYRAEDPLPMLPGWSAGELHCHTSYGADYVEFGAPLEAIQRTAEAIGLGWTALTDHSYNLDDLPDDFLRQDPELIKWQMLWEEAERLSKKGIALLPGEELTVRNGRGRNVHLIILGNREFLFGSGDGAEKWFRTRSELSINEALSRVSLDAFTAAAHPLVPTPRLEWLLVGRGEWSQADLAHDRLDGWQIANGSWTVDFNRGYRLWEKSLEQGKNIPIFAGNDAHGNFNRFRQVRLPMMSLHEHNQHIFGNFRTMIQPDSHHLPEIISALKNKPVVITDGPALELTIRNRNAIVNWKTTPEYGKINSLKIFQVGNNYNTKKTEVMDKSNHLPSEGNVSYPVEGNLVRAEVITETCDGRFFRAYTGAVQIENNSALKNQ